MNMILLGLLNFASCSVSLVYAKDAGGGAHGLAPLCQVCPQDSQVVHGRSYRFWWDSDCFLRRTFLFGPAAVGGWADWRVHARPGSAQIAPAR